MCPVFLLSSLGTKVLLILKLAQPSPWPQMLFVVLRSHHKRELNSSWCCQKAAVPPCLGSGKAGRLRGEAALQRRVSQVCRQSSQGRGQGL